MVKGSETTPADMMLDTASTPASSPLDDDTYYLESLEEPLKSMARKAIPPKSADVTDAASRLDQLELEARSHLLNLFFDTDSSEMLEKAGTHWKAVLNLCLHLVHGASTASKTTKEVDPRYTNMAPRKLPFLLIEDCLDAMTVEDAKKFWVDFVEPSLDHPQQLLGELIWRSSNVCHLPFLRVCNQFLRVLDTASYNDHGECKGRILTALAKGFSIADRSAFKCWGIFHSSNIEYETEEIFEANGGSNSSSSGSPGKSKASSNVTTAAAAAVAVASKMDYTLYESFWSLQADFSNPNRIQVAAFIRKLKTVLEALESAASRHSSTSNSTTTTPTTTPVCASIRYMTSSSLLPTQLATPYFRSCVVTQFLIVASHISSESPPLANALAPFLARAKKLLQSDHPELYHLLWESILAHGEVAWRKWKKDKSPVSAFAPKQKPEVSSSSSSGNTEASPSKSQPLMAGPLGTSAEAAAAAEHEYESLQADELLKVSQDLKKAIPSLEGHLEPYVEALDPESGIEADYHPGNDPLFAWRAMRLYAKHQLQLLKQCRRPEDLERITRLWYQQQGKEIPGEMPPGPPEEDLEEDEGDHKVDPESQDGKESEMDEREHEKDEVGSKEEESRSSDDDHEKEATSSIGDPPPDEKLSEKEEGNYTDDKSMGSASVEEKEEAGDAHDSAKRHTDGDDDSKKNTDSNSSFDGDQAKEHDDSRSTNENSGDDRKEVRNENSENVIVEKAREELEFKGRNDEKNGQEGEGLRKLDNVAVNELGDPEAPNAASREASDEEDSKRGGSRSRHRDSSSRKRRRSRSEEMDRNKAPRGPSRDGNDDQDRDRRDRDRSRGSGRGSGRRNDGPARGRGRNDERDGGPPARGGRGGGPPPRRDDGHPPPHGRGGGGGRHDDGPHGRSDRYDGQPPPPRRQDDGPPPSGRGGGGRGGDRHRGGGDRRRGRDDSRFRGRR